MISLLSVAHVLGLIPDPVKVALKGRGELCEILAIQFAAAVQHGDAAALRTSADAVVERNPDLLSVAVRKADGEFFFHTGNHAQLWGNTPLGDSTTTRVQLPIFKDNERWATVELCFRDLVRDGFFGLLDLPIVRLVAFMVLVGFLLYYLYLRSTLRHLDPSAVIPERVKATLDTLAEGVVILDDKERIVMANEAFSNAMGKPDTALRGRKASQLPWEQPESDGLSSDFPWLQVAQTGTVQKGVPLKLQNESGMRTFVVNSAPVVDGDGRQRGTIATFDDVTGVEEKNVQLEEMLIRLEESRAKVKQKNEELTVLSTRDPLTGCLNRRALFEQLKIEWEDAKRYRHALACVMVDIDHFKRFNDRFGHGVGDQVLKKVAKILEEEVRKSDSVYRYGGEEFFILLPHTNVEQAKQAAEKLRCKVESTPATGISVTVSLGVSSIELDAETPEALIDLADKALYVAKNAGRNQVVRADQMPDVVEVQGLESAGIEPESVLDRDHISVHAVKSLLSALSYRNSETETHCRRVADLCVIIAENLMSFNECFVLEVAGLLHDIGKIGVPDSILLKPGPLTDQEWEVMGAHEHMGIVMIEAAFGSPELTNIIRNHHAFFGGNPRDPGLPTGFDIPLRARILSIADAFDAMTSDRVYRKGRSREEAFAELRRCAGTQFDPELVELLIKVLSVQADDRGSRLLPASVETALRIGLELERLTVALDVKDISTLTAMTGRLVEVATKLELPEIARLAAGLHESVASEFDLEMMLETTTELLEQCHSIQSEALRVPEGSQLS